ncbi:MAG: hypothetical protein MUF71_15415 [Candidatus Kapabacteria bacterium]|jgi:hypothetical protein|nr:hypothetical protein [Candidatus Kapabacteria bacterium]
MTELINTPIEAEIQDGHSVERHISAQENSSGEIHPQIKRARVDSLIIYDVTEGELETIERGSPSSLYLNISIALLSIAISFLITLLTFDFKDKIYLFIVFVLVTIVGICLGVILFIVWWRTKNDVDIVLKKIKERANQ